MWINIKLLIVLTILTLLPSIIIMMTSFTRIIVVFSFLKNALGAQQSIPNQILIGLALFLTIFIMQPVYTEINENAFKPFMNNTIYTKASYGGWKQTFKGVYVRQTKTERFRVFIEASKLNKEEITRR